MKRKRTRNEREDLKRKETSSNSRTGFEMNRKDLKRKSRLKTKNGFRTKRKGLKRQRRLETKK